MSEVRWLVVVGLVACGRVGFDGRTDGGIGGDGAQLPVANRAFVTSSVQVPGGLGGVAGADAVCAARASEAGLSGTFVAYVSTTAQDAADRLRGARGWTRVDGKPVFDTVDDLLASKMIYPIRLDEHGTDLFGDITYMVTTGTYAGALNSNCIDFTDPGAFGMAGYQHLAAQEFANVNTVSCAIPTRLYCFQIDLDVPLSIEPVTGRTAFVSSASFAPSSGLAAADALCMSDATGAGIPGEFRALLPTTAPAADRFDVTAPGWVRVDGAPLAASATDFLAGASMAPLNLRIDGTVSPDLYVQTGLRFYSAFQTVDPTDTCDTWTNPGGSSIWAYTSGTMSASLNVTTANCTDAHPVYCLEK